MRDRAGEASALPSAEKSRSRRRASAPASCGTALLEPAAGSVLLEPALGSVLLGSVVRPSMAPGYAAHVSAIAEPSRTHTRTMTPHTYETHTRWSGTTAGGIRSYSRNHVLTTPPAEADLDLSADPSFRGDPARWNPEQLVVAAAASCQMLSFLGAAARAGVTVVDYADTATSRLLVGAQPARLDTVTLDATVTVPAGTDHAQIEQLAQTAHDNCFISNSLAVTVEVTTTVVEER